MRDDNVEGTESRPLFYRRTSSLRHLTVRPSGHASTPGKAWLTTMQNYIFRPGPVLVAQRWVRDGDTNPVKHLDYDVANRAHEYLFETIEMDSGVTLADVFRLLDRDPVLQQVFRRDWAEELCAEARRGPLAPSSSDPARQEGIEWLELYQEWNLDTARGAYLPTQRLQFHGIGVVLREDAPEHHRRRGDRITWALSLTPVRELLTLPLRINPEVLVMEDDLDSASYGLEIARFRHPDLTLGQIIGGVLYELGFHGGPDEQAECAATLKRRMDEVDSGAVRLIDAAEIFGRSDQPGCDALFDDLGGRSAHEISTAMRRIGDVENAASWFEKEFGGHVVVKAQFRDRGGREFRKAFRAASR